MNNKTIRSFSFNLIKDEIVSSVEEAIAKSPFLITQKELEYFLAMHRVVRLVQDYVKDKYKANLKIPVPFGLTIEKFTEIIKQNSWYNSNDSNLEQMLTLWPVSGSVLCEFYKKYQFQAKGKKLKKKKPTRAQRFFPVMKNTEIFVLEQRVKLHRKKLRNAVLKLCQAKRRLGLNKKAKGEKKCEIEEEVKPVQKETKSLEMADTCLSSEGNNNLQEGMSSPRSIEENNFKEDQTNYDETDFFNVYEKKRSIFLDDDDVFNQLENKYKVMKKEYGWSSQ